MLLNSSIYIIAARSLGKVICSSFFPT